MRTLMCLVLFLTLLQPAAAARKVDWRDLIDPKAQAFDDPFAALGIHELRSLGTVIRLRQRLSDPEVSEKDKQDLRERLEREEAKLAASGVETDRLLSMRKDIARKRAEAAMSGNPELDGVEVVIPGYVIPVLGSDGETSASGYLVPERGMCSHTPAPDPNQMIRYRLATDWQADSLYERVQLVGTLSIQPTRQEIMLLDGHVQMIAVFDLQVTDVRPLSAPPGRANDRTFLSYPAHAQPGD